MRRVDFRFVVMTGVALLLACAAARFWHDRQAGRLAAILLQEALSLESEERFSEAAACLTRYLKFAPQDTGAMARLGPLLARIPGGQEAAFLALENLLRHEPERNESRRALVRLSLSLGRLSDARAQLERLLPLAPQDPELLALSAQCQAGEGHFAQAEETLRAALVAAPGQIDLYDRLSRLLHDHLSHPEQAAECLDAMVAANDRSAAAYVVRSGYRRRGGALPAARDDMDCALALAPDDVDTLLAAADLAQMQGQFDRGREHLTHAMTVSARNSAIRLAAIRLELQAGDAQAALTVADRALDCLPNHPELLWSKADLLVETGDKEQAMSIVEQLQRAAYPLAPLCYLKGRILFGRRQWLAAAQQFSVAQEGIALAPEVARQADHWVGRCYEMSGNLDLALAAYRQVVALAPGWLPGLQSLASALDAAGRSSEATETYQQITRLSDAPSAVWQMLARRLILRNLAVPEESRDWDEVESALDEARRHSHDAIDVAILHAEMLLARGRAADAAQTLTDARDANPSNAEAWAALVDLAVRQADWARAGELLAAAETACGDRADLRIAHGRLLAEKNGSAAGRVLVELEDDNGGFSPDEQLRLLRALGAIQFSIGRVQDAIRLWSIVAAQRPHEIAVRLFLLDAARRVGDQAALEKVLDEISDLEGAGQGAMGRYAQAVRLVDAAGRGGAPSLASAHRLLNEATIHRPAWSRFSLLEAEVDEFEGNSLGAIQHLGQAIDLGDRTPELLRHTVGLLYRENRFVEADQILRAFDERSVPFSTELAGVAAEVSLRVEDHRRTVDLVQLVAGEARRCEDYVWLGQLLTRLRRDDQAENAYRAAIDQSDSCDSAWVAFVRFLYLSGQMQRIELVMAEAASRTGATKASLTLARCYEAVDQPAKAELHYKLACQSVPPDCGALVPAAGFYLRVEQPTKAAAVLRRLLKTPDVDRRTLAWARRSLAMILAAAGDYASFRQALDLIEQNLKLPGAGDEDLRYKARVLAARGGGRCRREALEILAGLERRARGSSDDRLLLAELYRADGQWPRARREMQILLAGKATPSLIASYLEGLMQSGELPEAGYWMRRLEKIEPEAQRTLRLRVRLRVFQDKTADAIQILDNYVLESGDPESRSERLGWTAHLCDEICSQVDLAPAAKNLLSGNAESAYRDWAAADPAARLQLCQFLVRRDQTAAALEQFEQAAEHADPKAISTTADILIGSHQLALPQLSRISSVLDAANERQNAAVLCVSQANLASLAGDYQRAESLYRRALEIEPLHVAALAKLALVRSLSAGQHAEALQLIEQAMEIAGPAAELLDARATVELAAGQLRAAEDDLKAALDDRPLASGYFHLAQLFAAKGDAKSAKAALEQGQEFGLSLSGVHPVEQRTYQQLSNELYDWSRLHGPR